MAARNQQESQLDYFMDVLLRNYCRASEENDILYEEVADLRIAMATLFRENSELRHLMVKADIPVPPSEFMTSADFLEISE